MKKHQPIENFSLRDFNCTLDSNKYLSNKKEFINILLNINSSYSKDAYSIFVDYCLWMGILNGPYEYNILYFDNIIMVRKFLSYLEDIDKYDFIHNKYEVEFFKLLNFYNKDENIIVDITENDILSILNMVNDTAIKYFIAVSLLSPNNSIYVPND